MQEIRWFAIRSSGTTLYLAQDTFQFSSYTIQFYGPFRQRLTDSGTQLNRTTHTSIKSKLRVGRWRIHFNLVPILTQMLGQIYTSPRDIGPAHGTAVPVMVPCTGRS